MAETSFDDDSLRQLQLEQRPLLDCIDSLRAQGIGEHVSLPQLIVCGDQSSGKSSVLEAISRVRFPTESSLCTRFATEVVLRHEPYSRVSISIQPGPSRSKDSCKRLEAFTSTFSTPEDLPRIIEEARALMSSETGTRSSQFFDDVLRVELSGLDKPHLTLVDLPGLIQNEEKPGDIVQVRSMAERYMANKKSTILAVVSARADIATQIILQLLKEHDPEGQRTLGIITKPDCLEGGALEHEFLKLARNQGRIITKLGWHVLRNRTNKEKNASHRERDETERLFLSKGVWAPLPNEQKGIGPLRTILGNIICRQIAIDLPNVNRDIRNAINSSKEQLNKLGDPRVTPQEQRKYLTHISTEFHGLIRSSSDGDIRDPFFNDTSERQWMTTRLRPALCLFNDKFAATMHSRGQSFVIQFEDEPTVRAKDGQTVISLEELLKTIDQMAVATRNTNLPGFADGRLVGHLFRILSKPWTEFSSSYLVEIQIAIEVIVENILLHLTNAEVFAALKDKVLEPWFSRKTAKMEKMLATLLEPHTQGYPMTHNRKYLDNIVSNAEAKEIDFVLRTHEYTRGRDTDPTSEILRSIVAHRKKQNQFCSSQVLEYTMAYYSLVLPSFIDNVIVLAVEQCFIAKLHKLFNPSQVAGWSDEQLDSLVGESEDSRHKRSELEKKLRKLNKGLRTCEEFAVRARSGSVRPQRIVNHIKTPSPRLNIAQLPTPPVSHYSTPSRKGLHAYVESDDDL